MSNKELDQLYLTKNERTGILTLLIILVSLIILPWLYYDSKILMTNKNINAADTIHIQPINKPTHSSSESNSERLETNDANTIASGFNYDLFDFDPNQLSKDEAKKLGINEKSFRALQNYLSTGARIYSGEQLKKIYGLDQSTFNRIEPYIKILPKKVDSSVRIIRNKDARKMIDINSANTEDLISLPAIGEKLATRIIKYRNLLGGFTNKSQLKEIYGLQDSSIQKFQDLISLGSAIRKINLNTVPCDSLKKHPYFANGKARVVCEYRQQHLKIQELNELYQIKALDSSWISRIRDYLVFD
jgi:DNA uptake protein ComE-like DNA-binding protein